MNSMYATLPISQLLAKEYNSFPTPLRKFDLPKHTCVLTRDLDESQSCNNFEERRPSHVGFRLFGWSPAQTGDPVKIS